MEEGQAREQEEVQKLVQRVKSELQLDPSHAPSLSVALACISAA